MAQNYARRGLAALQGTGSGKLPAHTAEQFLQSVYGKGKSPSHLEPLGPAHSERGRHLHIDSIGLCNFTSLYLYYDRPEGFLLRAKALVDHVHNVLGRHRRLQLGVDETQRLGDATDEEPLVGGLRGGKVMGEDRAAGDGQFWYPTMLWAFALNRLAVASGEGVYNELAAQLLVSSAPSFLVRPITDGGKQGTAVSVHPRISIDRARALPGKYRVSDPLVGAFVCGLVSHSLPDNGKFQSAARSLGKLEARLTRMWLETTDADREELMADPLQVGDALWVASWGAKRPWGKLASTVGRKGLEELAFSSKPVWEQPFQQRYPPGELWMVAGARCVYEDDPSLLPMEPLERAVERLMPRMTLWGPPGMVYFTPAMLGGVFMPSWVAKCHGAAKQVRNDPIGGRYSRIDDGVL
eukprot:Sspe_Gene.72991::Locus_43803_Transcript_1_1_Confidence_1.000_Length_1313::g.72991::m.72991